MLMSRRRHNPRTYLQNLIKDCFQHKIERQLAQPFEKYFGCLAEGDIRDVIKLAEPYIHHSFEGEAILSIGKMIQMHHHGAAGVVSVGPFTCMPSNIVSAVAREVSIDCNAMPVINISYNGQQDPTLQTRLEAFIHQVKSFQEQRAPSSPRRSSLTQTLQLSR